MDNSVKKRIAVLGATGSIGRQTLDIISRASDRYHASVLVAGSRVDELIALSVEHRPALAVIAAEELYPRLRDALAPYGIATACGEKAIVEAVTRDDVDMVLTATVGYSGLAPTIAAIRSGKDIALANKETLVVAGALIERLLKEHPVKIYPVDSEHSAIYQCLKGESTDSVHRLIITASGGPFRQSSMEEMISATPARALRHPNWSMGAKITIDSATMLNKAFEIIEARWLFGINPERIRALVHPQSIIHSMVEFTDGAVKAQLGTPDMRLPIAYALGEATRADFGLPRLTLSELASLTFEEPDTQRFPCLGLAYRALESGGTTACVINAANEIAVDAFLHERIRFTDIYRTIEYALEAVPFIPVPEYDDYVNTNAEARTRASEFINTLN